MLVELASLIPLEVHGSGLVAQLDTAAEAAPKQGGIDNDNVDGPIELAVIEVPRETSVDTDSEARLEDRSGW